MNADANVRNALFFNILKYAWSHCLDRSINTVMMVDEAHILLSGNNTIGADFLAQIQRRARKYNSGTLLVTQQPSDFANPAVITQGKAIFGTQFVWQKVKIWRLNYGIHRLLQNIGS